MISFVPPHILDEEAPPSIVINPHSEMGKELRRWEQHRTDLVPRGTNPGNPYVYREFPKMLYRAQKNPMGKVICMDAPPNPFAFDKPEHFERAMLHTETFNKSCQRIVHDDAEERLAKGQGWAESIADALALFEKQEQEIGNAAAEIAAAARGMTAQARSELATVERQTHEHVVDVKAKRQYTRKSKAASVPVTGSGEVAPE